jgi:hypothetical protein
MSGLLRLLAPPKKMTGLVIAFIQTTPFRKIRPQRALRATIAVP